MRAPGKALSGIGPSHLSCPLSTGDGGPPSAAQLYNAYFAAVEPTGGFWIAGALWRVTLNKTGKPQSPRVPPPKNRYGEPSHPAPSSRGAMWDGWTARRVQPPQWQRKFKKVVSRAVSRCLTYPFSPCSRLSGFCAILRVCRLFRPCSCGLALCLMRIQAAPLYLCVWDANV